MFQFSIRQFIFHLKHEFIQDERTAVEIMSQKIPDNCQSCSQQQRCSENRSIFIFRVFQKQKALLQSGRQGTEFRLSGLKGEQLASDFLVISNVLSSLAGGLLSQFQAATLMRSPFPESRLCMKYSLSFLSTFTIQRILGQN